MADAACTHERVVFDPKSRRLVFWHDPDADESGSAYQWSALCLGCGVAMIGETPTQPEKVVRRYEADEPGGTTATRIAR